MFKEARPGLPGQPQRSSDILIDTFIGWRGATPATQARLLERCCAGIRPDSIVINSITALLISAFILAQAWSVTYIFWLIAALTGGVLPRAWAAWLRHEGRFCDNVSRKALIFIGISVVYGLIWGAGPLLILPTLRGPAAAVFLILIIFGTIIGSYAAMPGILYARLLATGAPTVVAISLYMSPGLGIAAGIYFGWLVLRTDVWRGYHHALRQEIELHETVDAQRKALQTAHDAAQRANTSLKILAETDPLTGIANRRQFIRRCESLRGPATVVIFDIDHFKSINDRFGHQIGDFVLITLASLTQEALRDSDVLARIGGDEFALLLPGLMPDEARKIAERIRTSVEGCSIESGKKKPLHFTVSLGVSSVTSDNLCSNVPALLQHADRLLYDAKRNGRNHICSEVWRVDRQQQLA